MTDEQLQLAKRFVQVERATANIEPDEYRAHMIDALDAVIAAATKPPVVVGLSKYQRDAIVDAMRGKLVEGQYIELHALLNRDPGEYVAVRREDLGYAYRTLASLKQMSPAGGGVHGVVCQAIQRLAPAIAKGGEPGEGQ